MQLFADTESKDVGIQANIQDIKWYELVRGHREKKKKEKELLRKNSNGEIDNSHFYGFLLIMKRILPVDKFHEMKESIMTLNKKYPFVRMDYYGFRDDWQQRL